MNSSKRSRSEDMASAPRGISSVMVNGDFFLLFENLSFLNLYLPASGKRMAVLRYSDAI